MSDHVDFADLKRLVGTNMPIILDIGANDGSTTLEFLRHFPSCTVHAFEPDERALRKLKANVKHSNAHIHATAIGAHDGEAEFFVSSGMPPGFAAADFAAEFPAGWDMSSSLRKPKTHYNVWPWCKFETTRKVLVKRLDTWVREAGLAQIDFIWADIQGAEGDLILGGREALSKTRYFFTEYSDDEWYEGQPTLRRLSDMLENFSIVRRYPMDVLFKNNAM